MADSHIKAGLHHGPDARVRVNTRGDRPILGFDLPGGYMSVSPMTGWPREPMSEDHLRFADDLVAAAERYRDVIAGARLWNSIDHCPNGEVIDHCPDSEAGAA